MTTRSTKKSIPNKRQGTLEEDDDCFRYLMPMLSQSKTQDNESSFSLSALLAFSLAQQNQQKNRVLWLACKNRRFLHASHRTLFFLIPGCAGRCGRLVRRQRCRDRA